MINKYSGAKIWIIFESCKVLEEYFYGHLILMDII